MTGFLTRAALALEPASSSPVWPASAPAAATRLLPLLSENVRDVPVATVSPRRQPRAGLAPGFPPAHPQSVRVDGPLSLGGVYDGLTDVWALCLGTESRARPELLTAGVYRHVFEVDAALHSHAWPFGSGWPFGLSYAFGDQLVRRATLVVDRGVSTWEHLSTMVRSLTLNATPSGVSLLLNLVAHSTDRASVIHPNLNALVEPDWPEIVFTDLEVRIGSPSPRTPLGPLNAVDVTGLQLNLSNHLKTRQRRDTGLFIGEPRRTQLPSVSGSLTLPYYENDNLVNWVENRTPLAATFTFTGPEIAASGTSYSLTFYVPVMQIDAVSAGTQGPRDRDQRLTWHAVVTDSLPSGFPAPMVPGQLMVEVVSTESSNPLVD